MSETVSNLNSVNMDEATVFKNARDRFFQHLSSEERAAFTRINSPAELLLDFKRLQTFIKDDSRWMKVFSAVKNCSDQLQPYFDIVGIVIQSHPEWAAIAWGALRLVLQLASNFVGFFEKLAEVLSQIASLIPAYSDVLRFDISNPSVRFRISLGKFYEDLLDFFQAVARVFTQKSGRLKRTPVVIGQLLWQPFEVRFQNFLSRLKFHREVLGLELDVLQFAATQSLFKTWKQEENVNASFRTDARKYFTLVGEMKKMFTGEQREKLIEAIRVWINPPQFAESYQASIAAREQGTASWLFDVDAFKRWRHAWNDAPKGSDWTTVLWVVGNPGTGKTVLAASCVQELRLPPHDPSQASSLVVYFFFEAGKYGKCKLDDAFRAILAQILHQNMVDDMVLDFFAVSMLSERREGQAMSTHDDMIDLLASLIKHIGHVYIVLDGLDECDEPDDTLLDLWKLRNIQGLQIILFSRPNVGFLRRIMKAEQSIYLTPALNATDLEVYFRRNLKHLQDLLLLSPTVAIEELITNLQLGADGMFLWARLMMNYLKSPVFSSSRRVSIILNIETPERLDEMYDRIIKHLSKGMRHEQTLARNIFKWLIFAESPLDCIQLNDILGSENDTVHQMTPCNHSNNIEEFANAVIVTCGGLVEFRHTQCHYIHYSALEYFRSHCLAPDNGIGARAGSIEYFFPPSFDAHTELATMCLSYIVFRAPTGALSGSIKEPANALQVDALLPFLRYAAIKWPRHLLGTLDNLRPISSYALDHFQGKLEGLLRLLSQFFLNNLIPMSWVETVYTYTRHNQNALLEIHAHLSAWADGANNLLSQCAITTYADLSYTVAAFSEDLTLLFKHWNSTLSRHPNQIWNDVTAFNTSPFFQQSSAWSLKILNHLTPRPVGSGTVPFKKISRFEGESGFCAILTIWSSRHFEDRRSEIKPQTSQEIREVSLGWTAQFELYNTNSQEPELEGQWEFGLEADEVIRQIQLFSKVVTFSPTKPGKFSIQQDLAVHFPISIGNKLDVFTVLRGVYIRKCFGNTSSSISHKSTDSWISLPIPVEHYENSTLLRCPPLPTSQGESSKADMPTSTPAFVEIDNLTAFRFVVHNDYLMYYAIGSTSITRQPSSSAKGGEYHENDELYTDDEDEGDEMSISSHDDNVPENECVGTSVAVFSTAGVHQGEGIHLLDYIKNAGKGTYIGKYAFHPSLPLLAIHCGSDDNGNIFLWKLKNVECSKHVSQTVSNFQALAVEKVHWTESLQFSACGKHVIIEEYGNKQPAVIPIGESILYNITRELQEMPTANHSRSSINDMRSVSLIDKTYFLQNEIVSLDRDSSTRLDFNPNSSHTDIQLVKNYEAFQILQPLLTLPNFSDIRHVNISLLLPGGEHATRIRIMMTKSDKLFCTLAGADEDTPTTIVEKETRALVQARKQTWSMGSLRLSESVEEDLLV